MPKKAKDLSNTPPEYLKKHARYMWRRIVPLIKQDPNVNNMDRTMIEAFCVNYHLMRNAYEHIQENGAVKESYKTVVNPVTGETIATDFTGYKKNPSAQILDSATAKLQKLGNELGLTPQSRAELMEIKSSDESNKNQAEVLKNFFKKE